MTCISKLAAVLVSITLFVMPAAAMPLHCIFMTPSGEIPHPCQMMGMNSSSDQFQTTPSDHSCCQVSAAKPESITVAQAPGGSEIVVPLTAVAFLSDLPAVPAASETFDRAVQSPGGPPQALLCTFVI